MPQDDGHHDIDSYWTLCSAPGDEGQPFNERLDNAWHAWLTGHHRFSNGAPLLEWDPAFPVTIERGRDASPTPPDIFFGSTFVVSDKCRLVIEAAAPGQIQFLACRVVPRRGTVTNGPLWIMNLLRQVDCIDMALSQARPCAQLPGRYNYGTPYPVVDLRRVPREALIFNLRHYSVVTLVRDDLRAAVRGSGLTGGGFHRWNWWANRDGSGIRPTSQPL